MFNFAPYNSFSSSQLPHTYVLNSSSGARLSPVPWQWFRGPWIISFQTSRFSASKNSDLPHILVPVNVFCALFLAWRAWKQSSPLISLFLLLCIVIIPSFLPATQNWDPAAYRWIMVLQTWPLLRASLLLLYSLARVPVTSCCSSHMGWTSLVLLSFYTHLVGVPPIVYKSQIFPLDSAKLCGL